MKPLSFNRIKPPLFIFDFLIIISIFISITFFFRLFFLYTYWGLFQNYPVQDLIKSLIFGLRFDIAITLLLLIPAWLFSFLPKKKSSSWMFKLLFLITLFPFIIGFVILFVDLIYYGDAGRRLSYEVFQISHDIPSTFGMIRQYPVLVGLFGILCGLFFSTIYRLRFISNGRKRESHSIFNKAVWHFIFITFFIIGLRGGLQSKPLRPSFAYLIGNSSLAHLSLNPIYTVFYAIKKGNINVTNSLPQEEAIQQVQKLVQLEGMSFQNPAYPLYQSPIGPQNRQSKKPNIVIMILEGWPAKYIGSLGGEKGITPQFDALAEKGILFKNFFAISHRSTNGIAATLCSLPTFEDMQIMNTSLEQNNYRCLGTILGENGYSTLFLHGAKTGSFGLNAFSQLAGFKKYLGKEDFDLKKEEVDPTWGMFDHIALTHFNKELKALKEPFGAVWFSLTTHTPFNLPSNKYKVTDKSIPDHEFIDTLKYADESLGNFFKYARDESYFKNTIFIILADHTAGSILKGTKERQHIPCLIYSPSRLSPKFVNVPGGQLDILPSVIDLLKIHSPHYSFGRSLMDSSEKDRFVFVDRGGHRGWFNGEHLLLSGPDGPMGMYNWSKDPYESNDLLLANQGKANQSEKELSSFIQVSKRLIRDNQLSPNITTLSMVE